MTTTSDSVRVGDIDIAYTSVGAGVPVIALHGAIGLGSTYMRALDSWADELQLVYYDQRGSGKTPLGDVTLATFAGGVEDLEALRRALGLPKVVVLGHSAGAYLAAAYAAQYPDSTIAVVLLNAGPPLQPELMAAFGAEMAARRTPQDDAERSAIESSQEYGSGDPVALERHQLNTFIPFFRERAAVDRVSLGFTEITASNIGSAPERMMGSLSALNPMERFASIHRPTLVVHGELDAIPIDWSRALAATMPEAEMVVLENGSHFPMVEDADALRAIVTPWIHEHAHASDPAVIAG